MITSAQRPTQVKPQSKLELAEMKLSKIKENTKRMLESKKAAQLKMDELKQQIAEQSKVMKESVRKADQQLLANKTALKSVQANIKQIKQEEGVAPARRSKRAMVRQFLSRIGQRFMGRRGSSQQSISAKHNSRLELAKAKLLKIKANTS